MEHFRRPTTSFVNAARLAPQRVASVVACALLLAGYVCWEQSASALSNIAISHDGIWNGPTPTLYDQLGAAAKIGRWSAIPCSLTLATISLQWGSMLPGVILRIGLAFVVLWSIWLILGSRYSLLYFNHIPWLGFVYVFALASTLLLIPRSLYPRRLIALLLGVLAICSVWYSFLISPPARLFIGFESVSLTLVGRSSLLLIASGLLCLFGCWLLWCTRTVSIQRSLVCCVLVNSLICMANGSMRDTWALAGLVLLSNAGVMTMFALGVPHTLRTAHFASISDSAASSN